MAVPLVLLFALFAGNFLGCAGRGVQDGGSQATLPAASLEETRGGTSIGGMANYAIVSGTSIAAPHVSGAIALLMGAFPLAMVGNIEEAVKASASDLGSQGTDNDYGNGLLDS